MRLSSSPLCRPNTTDQIRPEPGWKARRPAFESAAPDAAADAHRIEHPQTGAFLHGQLVAIKQERDAHGSLRSANRSI